MSFELGFVTALGRNAMRERDERRQREREERELSEQQNAKSLAMLQKIVETDNLLPDEARNIGAQHVFRLATSNKTKPKDYEEAVRDILAAANAPRPTPQTQAADKVRATAERNIQMPSGVGSLFGTMIPRLPSADEIDIINLPRSTTSGILSRDEIQQRSDLEFMRRLAMQQQYTNTKPQYFELNPGSRLVDPTGKLIAEGNAPAPKQNFSRKFEETLLDPNATPEQRQVAHHFLTLRATNQGDTPRMTSGGFGPRYQRQIFQNPDGSFVEISTNPYDISEPPSRRQLGGDIQKPLNEGAKNARKDMQALIEEMTRIEGMLPEYPEATGPVDSLGYKLKSWGLGEAPSEEVIQIRTGLYDTINQRLHDLSGAAISAQEYARLRQSLPMPNDRDEIVTVKLNEFNRRLKRVFQLRYGPNGVGDAAAFPGDVEGAKHLPKAPGADVGSDAGTGTGINSDLSTLSDGELWRIATGGK